MTAADVSPRPPERQSLPADRPALARGISLYAALFGLLLLLLLAALISEDRALDAAHATQARRDAITAARRVEVALASRTAVIRSFGAFVTSAAADPARWREAVMAIQPEALQIERLIVMDSAGGVRDTVLVADGAGRQPVPELLAAFGLRPDSLSAATGPMVRAAPQHPGRLAIAVALPETASGAPALVIGVMNSASAFRAVLTDDVPRREAIVIRDGADTIALEETSTTGPLRSETEPVRADSTTRWQLEVLHRETDPARRATFWALGGSALLFLVLGLARERRHAQHVAERSAELERLSTELLRSNRMKSEFLANISHELRTPLNAIVGFVELLKDGVYGELSPRQINPVERIAGSATHLRHLVDQVLDIAKMAAGRLEVHLESVVLRPFVLNVASELESLAADKGIVLSLTVSASLPRVRTDPSHLRQILVNLVGNAIKYTPAGGAVAIRTRVVAPPGTAWRAPTPPAGSPVPRPMTNPLGTRSVEDEATLAALARRSPDPGRVWIAVQVSDTGIGIAPQDQERIFEEFEQVDAGPRGESMQRGTGLGLPISRRLARLLGGDVTVESTPGRGATFTVWIPVESASGP